MTVETEIRTAMSGVGVDLSSDMLSKCVAIAKNHSFSASQMATTWETYSLNHNADTLSRHTFASFRSALLSNSAANKSRSSDKKGSVSPTPTIRGAVLNRPAMGKRSYPKNGIQSPSTKRKIGSEDVKVESPITANAATSDFSPQVSSSSRAIVTPSKTIIKQPNQSKAYGNRTNSGQVMITYNPKKLNPITSSTSKVEITKPYGIVEEYKYMTDNDRSSALNSHLVNFQTEICSQNKIKTENGGEEIDEEDEPTLEHVGVPHPTTQINIGRICNEAHEGKMNKTSILLEGSKNGSNGARISLDVSRMKNESFSLFSGQIVGIKGVNSSGRKIVVEEFIEGLQTKLVKSNKDDLRKMYEGTDGNGTKMYAVAGPYTTNQDLKYEPLIDLLNLIVREKPAVVIMMGPFIDSRQALLKEGDEVVLEYEQDESEGGGAVRRHVSYETLFAAKISQELEDLYTEFPELKTKFVLVPSLDDAISEPVFPQPPFKDTLPNGGKQMDAIPETEEIPFGSLCLDTIETAGNRKIPKNAADRRVHLVSNPSTIKINEVTIGLTSTDALMHLSTEEINQNLPPGTRICRLAEHFIHQQSYYPIFPPPSVGGTRVNLDVNMRSGYSLPVQPDILLLPSKLTCLAKDVAGGTIAINPGHLVKGAVGGTFAVIDIHPINKEKLGDDEEEVISDVKDRTRVEIRKI